MNDYRIIHILILSISHIQLFVVKQSYSEGILLWCPNVEVLIILPILELTQFFGIRSRDVKLQIALYGVKYEWFFQLLDETVLWQVPNTLCCLDVWFSQKFVILKLCFAVIYEISGKRQSKNNFPEP
jgi:hypothetical protein